MPRTLDPEQEAIRRDLEACATEVLAHAECYSSDVVDYARQCLRCVRAIATTGTDEPAGDSSE